MKYFISSFALLFFVLQVQSQRKLSGRITGNEGEPIGGANILVTPKGSAVILSFAMTDGAGNFNINLQSAADSIVIKVVAFGFSSTSKTVSSSGAEINFQLNHQVTELPTVIITTPPIAEVGDTINFRIDAFSNKQDRVIRDVIARLPGIEIDAGGQITFQGESISHYYIDGLDLLGDQYNIANQNIPADLVDRVQILRNHQNIKLLDSLKTSDQPALNLKLKKKAKNRLIGNVMAGAGATPLLWDNAVTGLNFNNLFQLITSFKNNNAGKALESEVGERITVQRVGDNTQFNKRETVINNLNTSEPNLAQKRYLFNNSNLFHVNILAVMPNKAQLKTNLSYSNDYTTQQGKIESTIFLQDQPPVKLLEKTDLTLNSNKLQGSLTYSVNNKNFYIRNASRVKVDQVNQHAATFNTSKISQNLKDFYYLYANEFKMLVPLRHKILTIHSNTNYNRSPQRLEVLPGQFESILNSSIPYYQLDQNAKTTNLNTDNNISFVSKAGKLVYEVKTGFEYNRNRLETTMNKKDTGVSSALADSLQNNLNWNNFKLYLNAQAIIKKGNKGLDLNVPIAIGNINTVAGAGNFMADKKYLLLNPRLDFLYNINKYWEARLYFNLQRAPGSFLHLTPGYVLKSYRNISRTLNNEIPFSTSQNIGLTLDYRRPVSAIFGSFSTSISRTKYNILYNYKYNSFFLNASALPIDNFQKGLYFNGNINKFFIAQKITAKLKSSLSFSQMDLMQQDKPVESHTRIFNLGFDLAFSKWKNFSLETATAWYGNHNYLKGKESKSSPSRFSRQSQIMQMNYFIKKHSSVYIRQEYYNIAYKDSPGNIYYLGDAGFRKNFKNVQVEIEWSNFTNNKYFVILSNYQHITQSSLFSIRPSNIIARAYFRF